MLNTYQQIGKVRLVYINNSNGSHNLGVISPSSYCHNQPPPQQQQLFHQTQLQQLQQLFNCKQGGIQQLATQQVIPQQIRTHQLAQQILLVTQEQIPLIHGNINYNNRLSPVSIQSDTAISNQPISNQPQSILSQPDTVSQPDTLSQPDNDNTTNNGIMTNAFIECKSREINHHQKPTENNANCLTPISKNDSRVHECMLCKKKFTTKHNLKQHFSIHFKIKPYQCKVCKRRFSQKHR